MEKIMLLDWSRLKEFFTCGMILMSKRFWLFFIGGAMYLGMVLNLLSSLIVYEPDGAIRLKTLPPENQSPPCSRDR